MVTELDAIVATSFSDLFLPTTLYTLAGGECGSTVGTVNDGIDEGGSDDYYGWPSEAFFSNARTRLLSITVAATENTTVSLGPLATYSNLGEPFEIAAPGERWVRDTALLAPGVLCGLDDTASCRTGGTSAAAPTVAGVAALIASGNLTSFGVPNAPVLKAILLNNHTVVDPAGLSLIPGNRGLTMLNLP